MAINNNLKLKDIKRELDINLAVVEEEEEEVMEDLDFDDDLALDTEETVVPDTEESTEQGIKMVPQFKTKSKNEMGISEYSKQDLQEKVVKIIKVGLTNIKDKDNDGNIIPPTNGLKNKEISYYTVKLKLVFDAKSDDGRNIVEYYPNIKFFIDKKTGNINPQPAIPNFGVSVVAGIYKKYAEFMLKDTDKTKQQLKALGKKSGKDLSSAEFKAVYMDNISDADFMNGLVGKKVKIKVTTGEFNGDSWSRNDIVEFVK